ADAASKPFDHRLQRRRNPMFFAAWQKALRQLMSRQSSGRTPTKARPGCRPRLRRCRPRVESLEDRTLPSTIFWKAATSGNWSVGTNWVGNAAPGAGDTAVIDAAGANYTVTLDVSPTVAGLTLNSANATLFASGRTFTVNGPATLSAGSVLWRGSTWAGSGTLTNNASMTAQGNARISSAFAQNGSLVVQGSSASSDTTLTVDNGFANAGTLTLQS